MSSARRLTVLVFAATAMFAGPIAAADEKGDAACAALENSLLPVPEWYAGRCLGGNVVTEGPRHAGLQGVAPGQNALYKTIFPAPIGFKFAPLPTLIFSGFVLNSQPLFAMAFDPIERSRLYAIDNRRRQLGIVSGTAFAPIAAINPDPGPAFTVVGLAFDPMGSPATAYVVASDGAPAGSRLFRIDVATAALTPVGTITNAPFVIDIAFDSTGQMYAHDIGADALIRVNKATAAPTFIGPTGMSANFAQGMMYDASDDTLYGCAFVTVPAQQGQLVRFNRATGAATVLAGPVPDEMECAFTLPTGACTAPGFGGLASATTAGTPSCAIHLAWNAAAPCPGTTVKYNIYRSTTPGAPPSAATLLQSCRTTLSYTDTAVNSGTRYYYRVRAEDNTVTGSGPCNNGVDDGNQVERSAAPTGPPTTTIDDVESGGGSWDTTGGSGPNVWTIVTTQSHSPTHSWFVADPAGTTDQRLRRVAAVAVPVGGGELSFWHAYTTENSFDGHVLEYSLDGGTTWSDILDGQGTLPANPNRFTQNGYDAFINAGAQSPLAGRQAWSGTAGFRQVRIDLVEFIGRDVTIRFRFASDASGAGTGVWIDDIAFTINGASCVSVPAQAAEPQGLAVDSAGNGVYEPNEVAVVAPAWRNTGASAITLAGALTSHTGPAGPTYTIPDGAASYGSIAVGATASCASSGNCYSVANTAATRPATHWDATALEMVTPTGATKTWTLHIGDSFIDVPPASGFFRFVETVLHKSVTGGCSATAYCPQASTTREQMAVFALVSKEGAGYAPPACGVPMFGDVPASNPFCRWIEELARRGVVGGCGGGNYCPSAAVTREQMAIFALKTLEGPTYTPPPCGAPIYTDVLPTSPFCPYIEELTRRGVVSGCGNGAYCPASPVSREQMSVFLTVTFGLTLYGL